MYVKTYKDGSRGHYSSRRECELRERLPYGIWTCADGREVLFNRRYRPLWERRPGTSATAANPDEWVSWKTQSWFFNDGNLPWNKHDDGRRSLARCKQVLREWGVAA
jgi:hypothetical protein